MIARPSYSSLYAERVKRWIDRQGPAKLYPSGAFVSRRLFATVASDGTAAPSRSADLANLFSYLTFLIWAEQGVVTDVCTMIARGRPYAFLPDVRNAAVSIKVQEAAHSRFAYAILASLEASEGQPTQWLRSMSEEALDRLTSDDPRHAALARFLMVIFAEIADFGTATRLLAEKGLAQPVRKFAALHDQEEILHRVYFRKVLEELVPQLSPAEGLFAARAIRAILRSFVVASDSCGPGTPGEWAAVEQACGQSIAYLEQTGFLADPERRRIFNGFGNP